MPHKILVVDDEASIRFGIRDYLEQRGFSVCEAEDCDTARQVFRSERPDVAVLDYALPDGSALELFEPLRVFDPLIPLIVLTGHATIDLAVRAVKLGAEQFLTKPIELDALGLLLDRLIESRRRQQQRQPAVVAKVPRDAPNPFIGTSTVIQDLAVQAARVARADCPVLVLGETGAGKGILTAWLHSHSPRASEPLVDLNCGSLSREFLESELFGHEKGAYTSAVSSKPGLLEVARHGSVFLDEIGDLEPDVQPKLLKVIEEKRFRRLGDVRDRQVDIRLFAATHKDLEALVEEKRFRLDLYYRINTVPLVVPPLRERPEDIVPIARELLRRLDASAGRTVDLTSSAERALREYSWPGNIRELRNVLERAVLLTDHDYIDRQNLRFSVSGSAPVSRAAQTLSELERHLIERTIQAEGGRVERAARRLGIPRSSLYAKLKRYGQSVQSLDGVSTVRSSSGHEPGQLS